MQFLKRRLAKFAQDLKGATAIEYGLLVGILAIGALSIVTSIGGTMGTGFNNINDNIEEPLS
ncbi:MAG: Flp family type IVb pilin [Pseudomonadota bacterium]